MSLNVTFVAGQLPQGYCFTGPQSFYSDIIAILTGTIPNITGVVIGNSVPGVGDQNKLWARLDGSGYLEGLYIYLGQWLRPHPVPPSSLEVRIWKDTEANAWAYDGGDGNDPTSNPPTDTTGAMWVVDHDFDFIVPMGVGTNTIAYDGNAATQLTLGQLRGEERHSLSSAEMPPHRHQTGRGGFVPVGADALMDVGAGDSVGVTDYTGGVGSGGGVAGVVNSHGTLPPVRGVFFIRRSARRFIVGT